jgi:hypothetical protein
MQRSGLIVLLMALSSAALAADPLAPPPGVRLVLEAPADGVQIYACEVKDNKFSWVFKAPEAALFDAQGRQIGTHGKGPAWTLYDGSSVTAELTAKEPSPEKDSIPWLLLTVKTHEGQGGLAEAAFIRRIDTKGGVGPATGCNETHKGEVARIRYSATYQFFAK